MSGNDTVKAGVDTDSDPVIPRSMTTPATCDGCPLLKANEIRLASGEDAEARFLRVQAVELSHKLALARAALRRMGIDPDSAYQPHEQERA